MNRLAVAAGQLKDQPMHMLCFATLALASLPVASTLYGAPFADTVIAYEPGTGFATEFGSGLGYTNTGAALGQPSRDTSFGPVQPFNPPFERSELVSIGTNGFIVVSFAQTIRDDPAHPFGLDFIVYGSAGFIDVDFPQGHTDEFASTFGHNPGATRVSVSADNLTFYELNPALAPVVDGLYPTDGQGQFGLPVNPAVDRMSLANQTLAEVRDLYAGSAGGSGYDLSWAWDGSSSVTLESVRYVRVDVLSGRAEIDGFAVVPEPRTWLLGAACGLLAMLGRGRPSTKSRWAWLLLLLPGVAISASGAASFEEAFTDRPSTRGWRVFGKTDLFAWLSEQQQLEVTWDSTQVNSFFYRPLGTVLTKSDDFSFEFDLLLNAVTIGVSPAKPYTFELALGLIRLATATNTNFFRGAGVSATLGPRNLVEFDYFPDSGFGATVAPTIVSTNNRFRFSDNHPLELTTGDWFHVRMAYGAADQTLRTTILRNGAPFGLPPDHTMADLSLAGFPDFRVDCLAVSSYSDEGQSPPQFAGSILAQGWVDNLRLTLPAPPLERIAGRWVNGNWCVELLGQAEWLYVLERSDDLQAWQPVATNTAAPDGKVLLRESNAGTDAHAFYQVRAERP